MEGKSLEQRQKESSRMREKHKDHFPVFITPIKDSKDVPELKKHKYLISENKTMGEFMHILRTNHFKDPLKPEQALYFFAGNTLLGAGMKFDAIYDQYKNEDGFLYIQYSTENTFGMGDLAFPHNPLA